jgi:hypothetical protein
MKMRISDLIVLSIVLVVGNVAFAQNAPIDFETGGNGTNWTWTTFENGGNEPFGIIPNPDTSGINTSATVGSMTTLTVGAPWAGVESQHGADIGSFSWDVSNSTVKIMVYKSVISDVGLKFAEANGEAQPEIKIANTLTNEWEELTFDLSGHIGLGATGILDQIIIFPDFDAGRTTDNLCYIDNISFSGEELPPAPVAHAPVPTAAAGDVISVFSDSYPNIFGTNFYPGWGQSTVVTEVAIEGNNTLLYSGLDYQGIELGSTQDLTGMDSVHIDFWSADSTELQIVLISQSSGEQAFTLPITNETWVNAAIPLAHFTDLGLSVSDIFQLKFVGNGDVYLDNIYFEGEGGGLEPTPHAPIDFEAEGHGADWTWTTFENGGNEPFGIVSNPDATGINTSATVGSMTTLTVGAPWAGVESQHGADIGSFSWDATNSTVRIMVYKSVISDVGIKFAEANGEAQPEIKIANTLINEWEELTFDLSSHIGLGATGILDQIIIFPDFDAGRTTDNLCYFDNITFSAQILAPVPVAHAPIPTVPSTDVISVFSDAYTNIASVNLNPGWGQATAVSQVEIEGNNTLLYSGLNYQGTEFPALDVTGMGYLHVDFWTGNSSLLNFFVISQTPTVDSDFYNLTIAPEQWVSVDIPLTSYPNVDLTDVFQFKVEGNGTIYWDNIYFFSNTVAIDEGVKEIFPHEFALEQNFPNPFNPSTKIRYSVPFRSDVSLVIYDIKGEAIVVLKESGQAEGSYQVQWDGTDEAGNQVSTGVYLARLQIGERSETIKMVFLK